LLLTEDRVILIDEPEAFLHPTQTRVLGRLIANFSSSKTQIIIATHSVNIIDGILAGSKKVTIFRMNRQNDNTTFRKISQEITAKLAKSPLLSSQPIQDSIFYRGVVVCEGDYDRCLYEAVCAKKFQDKNILFVHAFNKQTIESVVRILKDAAIPVCAVVDFDVLNSESDFSELLTSFGGKMDLTTALDARKNISEFVNGAMRKHFFLN